MQKPSRRGDRVVIVSGSYAGHRGTLESIVFQKTVDYPEEPSDAFHIRLDDAERVVTVRFDQVESA